MTTTWNAIISLSISAFPLRHLSWRHHQCFRGLSNWNANKSNEMTWNFETSRYELTLLLKQGYYNFIYVYVPEGSATADHINLEGSFWETENNYQIFVYYKEMSGRYDRLIGYTQLNSANL